MRQKTIRLLLGGHKRGRGLKDQLRFWGEKGAKWLKKFWNPAQQSIAGTAESLYKISTPWVYMKSLFGDWIDIINWARAYGKELPDITPELNLFIEQSENGTTSVQMRNKAIITRLVDMNRRYLQLNTTPAKDAFNRVMATTTINSIRAPDKASEYIAEAELDLGSLFRDTLGSNKDSNVENPPISWKRYIATLPYQTKTALTNFITPQVVSDWWNPPLTTKIHDKYTVIEPHDITKKYYRESSLPSSILHRVPFPDELVSGRYVPQYEHPKYPQPALEYYPIFKKKAIREQVKHRNVTKRYRRRRKINVPR